MTNSLILVIAIGTAVVVAGCPVSLQAQARPGGKQLDANSVRLDFRKQQFAIGEEPIAVMTITNLSQNQECLSTASSHDRVHVTKEESEPRKTEMHRHLLGEFRPGDGPDLREGPVDCRPIAPGSQDSFKYDLTGYYDLSAPGSYTVYIEIYDPQGPRDGSGRWLRTNTAHFEIVAAK